MALLVDTVGQEDIGQYMGYVGVSLSLAFLLAPLLGGVVFAEQGYEAVYAMAWGLLGVDVVLRLVLVERKIARPWLEEERLRNGAVRPEIGQREDREKVASAADGSTGLRPETLERVPCGVTSQVDSRREENVTNNGPLTSRPSTPPGAVVLAPLQITLELHPLSLSDRLWPYRRQKKLPPLLQLCSSPRLLVALYSTIIQGALLTSLDSTLPIFVQQLFQWTSLGAGLIFLPLVLPSFLSPVVGWLSDRYGPRWLTAGGFLLGMPFLVTMRVVDKDDLQMRVALCGLLAGVGVALAMALPPVMAEISYVVDAMEKAKPGTFGFRGAYAQAVSPRGRVGRLATIESAVADLSDDD